MRTLNFENDLLSLCTSVRGNVLDISTKFDFFRENGVTFLRSSNLIYEEYILFKISLKGLNKNV